MKLSYAPYSEISARRVETMRLTLQGKFAAVEAILLPLQAAYEKRELNEFAVATAFAPFSAGGEEMKPQLDRWVAQSPESWVARLARARWQRGAFLRHSKSGGKGADDALKAAIADHRAALGMNPRAMIGYADLVELAGDAGDEALLDETIRKAFEADPTTWIVRDALLRFGMVRRDRVDAFLTDAARHEKQNPMLLQLPAELRVRQADRLWRDGKRAEALAIYDELVKTLDTFELRKHRARLLRTQDRFAESRVEIDRAIALMPGKYDGYRERAWLHADTGQWQEMLLDARRGLEIHPLDSELNRALGWALEELGDVRGAIEAYSTSAKWAPKSNLYVQIGNLELERERDAKAALAAYERAVQVDPRYKWAWYGLADALETLGDARAVKAWQHFLSLADPKSAEDEPRIAWARKRIAELGPPASMP